MYVGSICLLILSIAGAAMILHIARTCIIIFKYEHPRYQINPLKTQSQNIYCILQSDTFLLCFGFFGHFKNSFTVSCTISQQHQSVAVKEK